MAERRVEHATATVGACPGERPSPGMPMHVGAGEIDRGGIETQQHTRAGCVEIANLIDLVGNGNRRAEERYQRIGAIRHLDDNGLVPWVLVEITADELSIFRPPVERVG